MPHVLEAEKPALVHQPHSDPFLCVEVLRFACDPISTLRGSHPRGSNRTLVVRLHRPAFAPIRQSRSDYGLPIMVVVVVVVVVVVMVALAAAAAAAMTVTMMKEPNVADTHKLHIIISSWTHADF